ncbi:MAG: aminotransferase class IV [Bacteroidales bacterium]
MSRLFETLCVVDGEVKHLCFHTERVARSCTLSLGGYIDKIDLSGRGVFRLRVDYDTEIGFTGYSFAQYAPKLIRKVKVVNCNTICYESKYTDRVKLDELLRMKEGCDDILILKNGFVTDTSFTNIIFEKNGCWFTSDSPLLKGTCRAYLLAEDVVEECRIRGVDLDSYERFMLVNAMLPFDLARALPIDGIIF